MTCSIFSETLPTTDSDLEDVTTTEYPQFEHDQHENLHIIYPAENFISTGGSNNINAIESDHDDDDDDVTVAADYQSTILSDDATHFIIDTTSSASDYQSQTDYSEFLTTEYNSYREDTTEPILGKIRLGTYQRKYKIT